MKISNKTRYGIQFMLNLSIHYGEGYINIKDIALKENISVKFLENIVSVIKPSELIKVKRGASGGYKLAKPPSDIRLNEIVEILEGELLPYEHEDKSSPQGSDIAYVTHKFLDDIKVQLTQFLSSLTMADLVKNYHNKQNNFMFYI
jgi:Rrf2 family protein